MRRKDKEIDGYRAISQIISSGFIRLGFFDDNTPKIYPFTISDTFENGLLLNHCNLYGNVSFQTHLYNGIKYNNKLCNYSAKYLSVYGTGVIEGAKLTFRYISGKVSHIDVDNLVTPSEKPTLKKQNIDFSSAGTLQIGFLCPDEIYIVPIIHSGINGSYYFHSAKTGRKTEILSQQPSVIAEAEIRNPLNKSEILYNCEKANVFEVVDNKEICNAMSAIVYKTSGINHNFTPDDLKNVSIFKIEINSVS